MADTEPLNPPWLKSKWDELKGKAKEEWSRLTNDDLDRAEGCRDQSSGEVTS